MLWTPTPEWKDQDAYIIGGGSSLRAFNFQLLEGLNTIGCNDAFRLGKNVVKYCMFGDASYFHKMKHQLQAAGMPLITVAPSIEGLNFPDMHCFKRRSSGLGTGSVCGWNYSTGAAAINAALSLGARRVFLLGIDMNPDEKGRTHWHGHRGTPTRAAVFDRFQRGFANVHRDHRITFPGTEVIHVLDAPSRLPFFPQMNFKQLYEHLDQVRNQYGTNQENAEAEGRPVGAVCGA